MSRVINCIPLKRLNVTSAVVVQRRDFVVPCVPVAYALGGAALTYCVGRYQGKGARESDKKHPNEIVRLLPELREKLQESTELQSKLFRHLCKTPEEGYNRSAIISHVYEGHVQTISSGAFQQFFPDFPERKRHITLVTAGLGYRDPSAHNDAIGVEVAHNYEFSTSAGSRCAEQNAFHSLMHGGIPVNWITDMFLISHTIYADGNCEPRVLAPCGVCREHLRRMIKSEPCLAMVTVQDIHRQFDQPEEPHQTLQGLLDGSRFANVSTEQLEEELKKRGRK
eukprot:gnl/MRDRNA2_/MRDRNA2_19068_c0_seq1.p1 gnl/MRDRNA2_/MRDRNA2_19068_c0~~gnl/MRDRNA2_/MRDRNA2_19068_c0_seq1.p1  ORF type:complete len:314 (+),score=35.41 gnl/MRDRNA2_/MRDRNA2_19068_c0_seq1:102-944(+)